MKSRDKTAPEVPAAGAFYNLFASKPAGSSPAGEPLSKVSLRKKAEAHIREREEQSSEKLDSLSPESMRTILHELRVHQIELEMQNEDMRRAQTDLDASRARYFDLYDLAPVGYCTVSEMGLILEANLTAATLLRVERGALVGRLMSAFISKGDQEHYYWCRKKLLDTNQPQECDLQMLRPDGTAFFAHLEITVARDENEEPVCRVALIDVTAHRQAEEGIMRQAALINSLLDSDPDIVFFKNTDGVYLGCNPAFVEFVGRPRNEIVGKTDHDLFDKEVADWFEEQDRQMLAERNPRHNEEWVTYSDGRKVLLDTLKTPYWGPDGELVGVLGISRDITEQKQAQEELKKERQRLAGIIEGTNVGTWEYNVQTGATVFNDRWAEIIGYTPDEIAPLSIETWRKFVHPDDLEASDKLLEKNFRGEMDYYECEVRMRDKDGSWVWVLDRGKIITRTEEGKPAMMMGTHQNITARKAIEASLKEALARAEAATRAKAEFLATMTHELRNPLSGILGFSELLADTPLNEEQQSYTELIRESGSHLLSLINDVLDFSSIEKGVLSIRAARFDLAHLVKLSSDIVRKSASDKGIAFHCDVAPDVPAQITGDERRIRQILINLLANAVKFTSDGSVSLRVTRSGKFLEFSVEDTGLGISSEALARLFQLFTQADSTINKKYGGTGIGLAVSQRLAEAMGGTISVVSVPGKGSTFTFQLPLEVAAGGMALSHLFTGTDGASPSSPSAEKPVRHDGLPVLVVEDDRTNATLVGKVLKSLGYRVEFSGTGVEAVEAFAPGKYLAILMDLRMPVMNGFEAVGIIRSRESGSRVPIIALSANVMPNSREIYLASGMDDFLSKPFKKEELAAKLACIAL